MGNVHSRIACADANVLAPVAFQNFHGTRSSFWRGATNRHKDLSLMQTVFVALGFQLGNAHADQRLCNTSYGVFHAEASQSGFQGALAHERSQAWNRQHTQTSQYAKCTAQYVVGSRAWRVNLMQIQSARGDRVSFRKIVRQEHGNIVGREMFADQIIDGRFGPSGCFVDYEDRHSLRHSAHPFLVASALYRHDTFEFRFRTRIKSTSD